MNENEWRQLVKNALNNDEAAFDRLYKETERSVYFLCLKLLGNEHDTKDAAQETYLAAFNGLSTLDDGASFPKWINGIAVNQCKRFFRTPKNESLDEKLEHGVDFSDDEDFIPEDYVADSEKRKAIMHIIDTELTEIQRQTIILYYYNRLKTNEIASIMSCPEGTVKYRLSAAREKIKEAVLIYEKENKDRLHAILPIPILTRILRSEAESTVVPDIRLFINPAASAKHLKAGGKATMKNALTGKIAAAAAAVVLAGGGITAAVLMNKDKAEKLPADSTVSSYAETNESEAESSVSAEAENSIAEDASTADESSEAEETKPVIDESDLEVWFDFSFYYPSDFFIFNGTRGKIDYRDIGENKSTEYMIRLCSKEYPKEYGKENFDVYDVPDMLYDDLMHRIDEIPKYNAYPSYSEMEIETVEERELLDTTFLRHTGIIHCRTSDNPEKGESIVYFAAYYGKIDTFSYHGKNLPVCWFIVTDDVNIRDDVENLADTIAEYAEWDEYTKEFYSSRDS